MGFLSDLVNGFFGNESADKAADSMVRATREANTTMMDMFNRSNQITAPNQQAGWNALAMQGSLLGNPNLVPQGAVAAAMAAQGAPGVNSQWDNYAALQPDVVAYFKNNPKALAKFGGDMNKALEYHWNTFGKHEGSVLPPASFSGAASGTGTTGVGVGTSVDDAYNTFLGSGFNRAMTDFTNNDLEQLKGTFAAGGKSLSGSAVGAMGDRLARNRYTAFGDYYNALSGISGTGAQLSSQSGQNAVNTGQRMAANQQEIGNIRGSSYLTQGQNNANMINSGVNALASWFGGS